LKESGTVLLRKGNKDMIGSVQTNQNKYNFSNKTTPTLNNEVYKDSSQYRRSVMTAKTESQSNLINNRHGQTLAFRGGKLKAVINVLKTMAEEADHVVKVDGHATSNRSEAIAAFPGLHAVWLHRAAHALYERKVPVLPRVIANISRIITGAELHPGTKLGKLPFIDHTGLVVGQTAIIGDRVKIVGNAVLGATGKDNRFLRHPIVEDDVTICMGAKCLGRIRIGKGAKIGADSLVLHDVPAGATVVGSPAEIISLNGKKVEPPILLKDYWKQHPKENTDSNVIQLSRQSEGK
jgi:serine O-acetyltransferase